MLLGLPVGRQAGVSLFGAEVPGAAPVEVVEGTRRPQLQLLSELLRCTCAQLVEDVVVALFRALPDHPGTFKQIVRDVAARHLLKFLRYFIIQASLNAQLRSSEYFIMPFET